MGCVPHVFSPIILRRTFLIAHMTIHYTGCNQHKQTPKSIRVRLSAYMAKCIRGSCAVGCLNHIAHSQTTGVISQSKSIDWILISPSIIFHILVQSCVPITVFSFSLAPPWISSFFVGWFSGSLTFLVHFTGQKLLKSITPTPIYRLCTMIWVPFITEKDYLFSSKELLPYICSMCFPSIPYHPTHFIEW